MVDRNKRALVTGATGFIGSHLTRRLVRDGWVVHVVVRPDSDMAALAEVRESVTLHVHDGTTGGLQTIIAASAPQAVFHLASLFLSEHRPDDIERLTTSNVVFATQLAEAMVQAGIHCLINTGTSWQHFEGREYCPVNLYAATKQAFEAILAYYIETTPLRVITLKLYDTYGTGDTRQKLFHLLRQVDMRQEPLAMSPGEQLIDLVHVDDVMDAYMDAAKLLVEGRVGGHQSYAVSSGAPVRLKDIVATYARLLGRDLPIIWGGRPYRNREVMVPWHSGPALPGWQPQVSLETGLRQLIAESEGQRGGEPR